MLRLFAFMSMLMLDIGYLSRMLLKNLILFYYDFEFLMEKKKIIACKTYFQISFGIQ